MKTINIDRNVSIRDYDEHAAASMLLVTNVFYTIQGEGPLAGHPAVFIRLAGCNIGAKKDCQWCDTAFAFDQGTPMHPETILAMIDNASPRRLDGTLVVVTGGEPLLQWEVLLKLMRHIVAKDLIWQFETNGMLLRPSMIGAIKDHDINARFVVSPKVPHNLGRYPVPSAYWDPDFVVLKYVVSADPTSPYYEPGPTESGHGPHGQGHFTTYISGMTEYLRELKQSEVANVWDCTLVDRDRTQANYARAATIVLNNPSTMRLSYQTHLFGGVE